MVKLNKAILAKLMAYNKSARYEIPRLGEYDLIFGLGKDGLQMGVYCYDEKSVLYCREKYSILKAIWKEICPSGVLRIHEVPRKGY